MALITSDCGSIALITPEAYADRMRLFSAATACGRTQSKLQWAGGGKGACLQLGGGEVGVGLGCRPLGAARDAGSQLQ